MLSAPSLASDLSWLLLAGASPSVRAKYAENASGPARAANLGCGASLVYDGREDLAERVRTFWGDKAEETSFTEMHILAFYSGALYATDQEVLWKALARAVATVPLDLEVPSESPEELEIFADRFRRLRDDPALLRSYLALLREVWAPVDDLWQRSLPAIEEAGRHYVSQFERGTALDVLIVPGCDIFLSRLPEITADIENGKPVVFIPCLFFGSSLYLEFPELVLIGTGVGSSDAEARARTESVARRLKAVADPTRLAILHSLAAAPSSVGELAGLFRLSQPTVSMHVKVLRQSGLVHSERQGGRLRLSADPIAVEALLGDLREAVLHGTTPTSTSPTAIATATTG